MKVTYEIENGNKVKVKTYVDGTVFKFDKKGNLIYYKVNDGFEEWYDYDECGRLIRSRDLWGGERILEYDKIRQCC